MADAALSPPDTVQKTGRKPFLFIAVIAVMLGAGFASSFFGIWSPMALLPAGKAQHEVKPLPAIEFVSMPQIVVTLAGPQMRTLIMAVEVETTPEKRAEIQLLLPRLSDAFNTFLAEIDPSAFEKRGILEIVRDELATRAIYILGKDAFTDILITEFRIQ
ncbi:MULTISPECIES: flagellar basal body-associated protein FliL [Paracoccus]|jgi:flagellar FliL protein|uniref:Flagellar protein FliL n=1 Tax=Paracoccus litorisediminis TaxID=2006130 RepID=A0A844HGV4_9RHOB|nr:MULTISPECIES: flagellar basal body-associated FliL family protein [Paracoccus]MBD9526604.1 flagellar basal body-associated FliL family protein [Paracoccus sp. PAR01]MTH59016.1 flagellar basal body protein FliL [Paracoccus litorisediminis]